MKNMIGHWAYSNALLKDLYNKENLTMELKTEKLLIRPFVLSDLNDMHEYCAQKEVAESAGWAARKSLQESAEILNAWITGESKYAIILLENNKVVGHIAIDPDSEESRADTRELGCALNSDYHRRGIMSEAILETVKYLFTKEAVANIWACCFQNNFASKCMIEKCGFLFEQEGAFYSSSLEKEFPSYEYCIRN